MSGMDEVRLQVIWHRLIAVVEEQAQALMRTAFSSTVREAGDLSAGVFDTTGRMAAQAVTGTPGHVNTMAEAVRHFLARFPLAGMQPGDHYITNDPWLASGHLHDITVVSPVFHGGTPVALLACCCHQIDVGGLGQGPDGRSIFEEGLQIPILRLAHAGVVDEVVMAFLRLNVRTPVQIEGDVRSYMAVNDTAGRRLCAMLTEFGLATLDGIAAEMIARSEAGTRALLAGLPRGTWHNEITLDGMDAPITLRAALHMDGATASVDFAGTSPLVPRGINVPLPYARACAVYGLKCAIAPDVPNNAGALAPFRVAAPEGCILNAHRPAPVAARHVVGQMLPDLVLGCLDQALPGQVPAEGASCVWTVQLRGQGWESVFFNSGGAGARPGLDGLDATAFPAGVRATPVEMTEAGSPVVVWRKEYRPGSGGPGRHRGGMGQVVEVGTKDGSAFEVLAMFERVHNPARGRAGGGPGAAGTVRLASGRVLAGKGLQTIPAGDRLVLELPGGGGHGAP
jgi:N-methylhydantoinase B